MERFDYRCQATDGLDLYGLGWEPDGEARAVVCLVHGLGEHCGRYAHVGAALAGAGYALMGIDMRGHGKSGGQRGHTPAYESLLEDIDRLLIEAEARYAGRPRFLYGHSMGGGLVLNYALRRRPSLAGVIATGPWLRLAFDPPAIQITLGRALDRFWPAMLQPNGLDRTALTHDPAVIRAYESDPLVHDRISVRLAVTMMDAGQWALDHAAEFPLPLLLVHGGADRITSAQASRDFAAKVPNDCTLKIWDGLYHETHNELQKEEVLSFMIDWLQAHTPVAAPIADKVKA